MTSRRPASPAPEGSAFSEIKLPVPQLERRFHQMAALSVALVSARDSQETITAILQAGMALVDAEGCSLALVDDETEELQFMSMVGSSRTAPFRIPLGTGVAGDVAQTGEPALVADVRNDGRFYRNIDRRTGFSTRSIVCIPIKRRGQVLGVMQALNCQREGGFVPADIEALDALGRLAFAALERAQDNEHLRRSVTGLRAAEDERYRVWISRNERMIALMHTAERAARSDATVLLLGESGVGKEVMARMIHRESARANEPFVALNCTALTASLLESELFGHEKGAFTGAIRAKAGKFELADGGTLFLDEVGDMAADLQTKLLRVLQERELERVGGHETLRVNVRVIAATNRDLAAAMKDGSFRDDLFYRLNVITLSIPPLRERPEDIIGLCQRFLERAAHASKRAVPELTAAAKVALAAYPWPGNIRELANMMERIAILSEGRIVDVADLPLQLEKPLKKGTSKGPAAVRLGAPMADQVREFKKELVREALSASDGHQSRAAALLGVNQSNLSRLMKQLELR